MVFHSPLQPLRQRQISITWIYFHAEKERKERLNLLQTTNSKITLSYWSSSTSWRAKTNLRIGFDKNFMSIKSYRWLVQSHHLWSSLLRRYWQKTKRNLYKLWDRRFVEGQVFSKLKGNQYQAKLIYFSYSFKGICLKLFFSV